jgi:hypothetical protein
MIREYLIAARDLVVLALAGSTLLLWFVILADRGLQ